ncbi:MAG: purine permease [Oscillospiraceae bacterium]|nr:purine permease [Oscillospiraceae bacterium]
MSTTTQEKPQTRATVDFSQLDEETSKMYILEARPKLRLALPVTLQHLLAMWASNLVPIMLISAAAGVEPGSPMQIVMLQGAMVGAGLATLLNCYPIKIFGIQIGANLPIVMGTSMTFVPPALAVAARATQLGYENVIGVVLGGLIVACVAELFLGAVYKWVKPFLPPIVLGAVLLSLGLSLLTVGMNNFGGNPATPGFGSTQNLTIAFTVFIVYTLLQRFGQGIWKLASVLIAMGVGYLMSIAWGMVNFAPIYTSAPFRVPMPIFVGYNSIQPVFEGWAIVMFLAVYVVSGLATIGYTHTITSQAVGRMSTNEETRGALLADAVGTWLTLLFNGLPNTEFGQNSALVAYTKVISKWVVALAAFILIAGSFFPPIGAVFATFPAAVIGGGVLAVFAFIMTNAIVLIAKDGFTPRKLTQLCITFAIGLGFANPGAIVQPANLVSAADGGQGLNFTRLIANFPDWLHFIFNDRVLLMAVVAILVNLLFMTKEDFAKAVAGWKKEEIEYI